MMWFRMQSGEFRTLLTARISKLNGTEVEVHKDEDRNHFNAEGDLLIRPVNLKITELTESDLGLYCCAGRFSGTVQFGRGILLTFSSAEVTERNIVPCWTFLGCVIPVTALFSALFVYGVFFRSGKPATLCSNCAKWNSSLQEDNLHYASLKHIRGRTDAQGKPAVTQGHASQDAYTT
ncbi:hypothetical protein UPYG_G00338870 [Umbra pygmaea]|uniref:Immunoglobulin V-set domain-containing protein n=1 Tax=Umbra pygmaea TaxID=75934 RepID=A0ABD0W0V5_UMBPY